MLPAVGAASAAAKSSCLTSSDIGISLYERTDFRECRLSIIPFMLYPEFLRGIFKHFTDGKIIRTAALAYSAFYTVGRLFWKSRIPLLPSRGSTAIISLKISCATRGLITVYTPFNRWAVSPFATSLRLAIACWTRAPLPAVNRCCLQANAKA